MRQIVLLSILALVFGCGGGGGGVLPGTGGGGSGSGSPSVVPLRIWVTDAPFPFRYVDSASVVIREVRMRHYDTELWEVVYSGRSEIDLVPLTNGVEALLVEAVPPPGTYDEVRLIVESGKVVLSQDARVEDGDHEFSAANGKLRFPSGAQTGIKAKIENFIVISTQLTADLVLDFDLSRNFVFTGPVTHAPGVKSVSFTPVVRAVNASTAGSLALSALSDNVTPGNGSDDFALDGATVRILDAADAAVATASTDADGDMLVRLPPGTYSVEIEAGGHATKTLDNVVVVLANLTDLGNVVLAAAGEIGGVLLSDGGTAADASDDVSVEGATVELRNAGGTGAPLATTTTDANGAWRFESLDAGQYDVTVTVSGFRDGSLAGIDAALTTPGYSILIEALPQDVTGTVTVPGGGDVTTVTIRAVNSAGVTVGTTAPAGDGTYSLDLVTGAFEIEFDDGILPEVREVALVGADPEPAPVTVDVDF